MNSKEGERCEESRGGGGGGGWLEPLLTRFTLAQITNIFNTYGSQSFTPYLCFFLMQQEDELLY